MEHYSHSQVTSDQFPGTVLAMPKTVLVVEDNELNMKLFNDLLEAHGYKVVQTRDGLSALDMARKHMPDLILMDIQLPEVSGIEVTKWLKEDDKLRSIPVIAVEETMRGWLAALAKERLVQRQVYAYRELAGLFRFFSGFEVVPFDDAAAQRYAELLVTKVRIGTMDLKIAGTALVQDALLLTANKRDFEQVPGLRFENWMDE